MDIDALHYATNHSLRARIVRIQPQAQTQVISEQLRNQDLERRSQIVGRIRQHGGDYVVKLAGVLSWTGDAHQVANPLGS